MKVKAEDHGNHITVINEVGFRCNILDTSLEDLIFSLQCLHNERIMASHEDNEVAQMVALGQSYVPEF